MSNTPKTTVHVKAADLLPRWNDAPRRLFKFQSWGMRICDETNGSLFFKSNQGLPLRWSVSSKSFFPHLTCLRQNLRTQRMCCRKRTGIEDFSEKFLGHCSNGSGITGSCWADTSFSHARSSGTTSAVKTHRRASSSARLRTSSAWTASIRASAASTLK